MFGKRKKRGQLWVRYKQWQGAWEYRVSNGNSVIWGGTNNRLATEFEAIDAGRETYAEWFPDLPEYEQRIFRTDVDYYCAIYDEDMKRKKRR